MFAFALWDGHRRRLLLARDRLGIKPLYYYERPGQVLFASEIKALLEHPAVPREVDPEALDLYLSLRYVPGPRTMFRGIHKLQPGHLLIADEAGTRARRYWELPRGELSPADAEQAGERLAERFVATWDETVRLHLASEVPLGVFLSGGLDSTAVLAAMHRVAPGERIKTFNVGYEASLEEDEGANEGSFARLAAEAFGSDHREIRLRDADFRGALTNLVWHLDEPVADPACVPLYFISRRAREEVTVVLSGEGADEILGGYGIYPRMLGLERVHRLLERVGGAALTGFVRRASHLVPGERLRHYARLTGLPLTARYRGVSRAFLPETKARLVGHDDPERADRLLTALLAERYRAADGRSPLARMLYLDTTTWLPDDLLVKADKMTMASSQELRVPFLDHELVELAATLPPDAKVRDGTGKRLLRDAMAGRIPAPILERPKKGFPVPTVPLLRHLGPLSRDLLLAPGAACRCWFDPEVVGKLLDAHHRGSARLDQEIWTLLVFELWHRTFIDRRLAPAADPAEVGAAAAAARRSPSRRSALAPSFTLEAS